MKRLWFGVAAATIALALFTGCHNNHGSNPNKGNRSTRAGDDDHDHGPGPHGGTIIDFGKWHAEFTVDHKKQEATVYILSTSGNKPRPIAIEQFKLSIKQPQFQAELKPAPQEGDPEGKSSRYVAKHENFGKEQEFSGTLSGVVGGTPYAAEFKEEKHKDHKHEKK